MTKVKSSCGWFIKAPKGYRGKTYGPQKYIYLHRYKMEKKLKRKLRKSEVVCFKNGNCFDARLNNLEIRTIRELVIRSIKKRKKKETIELTCDYCGESFTRDKALWRGARKHYKQKNHYCGKGCMWASRVIHGRSRRKRRKTSIEIPV